MKEKIKLKKKQNKTKILLKKYKALYLIMAVIVAYYIVFNYIPIIMGVIISFKDMKVGGTVMGAKWVGLDNYREIFENPQFLKLLVNTLRISLARLFWGFWPPIVLAIMIFDIMSARYKKFCQTIIYIPFFFSWVIIYGIVFSFFSGQGLVNGIMDMIGVAKVDFLTSKDSFIPLLIGSQIWKGAGWGTILYFAALTSVSPDLFEACRIDGAGPIRRILTVTLPALMPVIVFNLIISLGGILGNDFEQLLLFSNAAVLDVADIIDTWVYRIGIGKLQYSLGAAVGLFKATIGFVLIVGANAFSRKVVDRSLW